MPRHTPSRAQGVQDIVNYWVGLANPKSIEDSVHKWVGEKTKKSHKIGTQPPPKKQAHR